MKHFLIALTGILLVIGNAVADEYYEYGGTWVNTNPDTREITKVKIQNDGGKYGVQVWGKCHPQDCDWGGKPCNSYADSHLTARFTNDFSVRDLTFTMRDANVLEVKVHTRFTDNSGRPERETTERFRRQLTPTTQTPRPLGKKFPKPAGSDEPTGKY